MFDLEDQKDSRVSGTIDRKGWSRLQCFRGWKGSGRCTAIDHLIPCRSDSVLFGILLICFLLSLLKWKWKWRSLDQEMLVISSNLLCVYASVYVCDDRGKGKTSVLWLLIHSAEQFKYIKLARKLYLVHSLLPAEVEPRLVLRPKDALARRWHSLGPICIGSPVLFCCYF